MEMFYVSTRGGAEKVRAAQAIKQGIAGNGRVIYARGAAQNQ